MIVILVVKKLPEIFNVEVWYQPLVPLTSRTYPAHAYLFKLHLRLLLSSRLYFPKRSSLQIFHLIF
jgi:hypothetical protein